jgi:nucleotide-binding universal stress UspA family protein
VEYSEHRAGLRKIGIAYDDSSESDEALNVARQIGKARGASVSVFHAVRARLPALSPGAPHDARDSTEKLGNVEACGDSVEDLLRYGRSVDLLVLGSRKHGPMSRLVHQSIAARLADDASSPLLVLSRTARR